MRALGVLMAATAVLVSIPSNASAQADLNGAWDLVIMTDQGDQMLTINIVQEGMALTASGDAGEFGMFEWKGTLEGADVTFEWALDMQGTPLDIVFTGTLAEGAISGVADFGGMGQGDWSAKRAD